MGSMLDMMKGMTGRDPGKEKGSGNSPGEGKEGSSDTANHKNNTGEADNTKEERRVPKSTSAPSQNLPREEQRALDAYNQPLK